MGVGDADARALPDRVVSRLAARPPAIDELGLDYINRQVPVERETRIALRAATGTEAIPALLLENGSAVVGEESTLVYLSGS